MAAQLVATRTVLSSTELAICPPRTDAPIYIGHGAQWVPAPILTLWRRGKYLTLTVSGELPTYLVACIYTDRAAVNMQYDATANRPSDRSVSTELSRFIIFQKGNEVSHSNSSVNLRPLPQRWFEIRRGLIFINLPNPSGRTRPWGLLGLEQK
jgi:hypothetical protein